MANTSTVDEAELAKLVETDSDMIFDTGFFNFTMEAVPASLEVVNTMQKNIPR